MMMTKMMTMMLPMVNKLIIPKDNAINPWFVNLPGYLAKVVSDSAIDP